MSFVNILQYIGVYLEYSVVRVQIYMLSRNAGLRNVRRRNIILLVLVPTLFSHFFWEGFVIGNELEYVGKNRGHHLTYGLADTRTQFLQ